MRPNVAYALKECVSKGYEPLFVPELLALRREALGITDQKIKMEQWNILRCAYVTASLRAYTHSTPGSHTLKGGNPVIIYAHVPNHIIADLIKDPFAYSLIKSFPLPESERVRFLRGEDRKSIFVIDDNERTIIKEPVVRLPCEENLVSLDDALHDPEVRAFFGGQETMEKYLNDVYSKYESRDFPGMIGIVHVNPLPENHATLLYVMDHYLSHVNTGFGITFERPHYIPLVVGVNKDSFPSRIRGEPRQHKKSGERALHS